MHLTYIVGTGHSGSSLLDVLLGSHPDILSCGEIHRLSIDPSTRRCGCLQVLCSCPLWVEAQREYARYHGREAILHVRHRTRKRRLTSSGLLLLPRTPIDYLAAATLGEELRAARETWGLLAIAARQNRKMTVIDSTKTPNRMLALFYSMPPASTMSVLRIVRDGRAVAASQIRRTGCTMTEAAKRWRADSIKAGLAVRRLGRRKALVVKYEDLCNETEHSLVRILGDLGLEQVRLAVPPQNRYHAIPGNPALLTGFGDIHLDTRWKSQLSARDLKEFDRIAGRVNAQLGYQG